MTKKELIDKLSQCPDDWNVYISNDKYDALAFSIDNIKILKSMDKDENPVIILSY